MPSLQFPHKAKIVLRPNLKVNQLKVNQLNFNKLNTKVNTFIDSFKQYRTFSFLQTTNTPLYTYNSETKTISPATTVEVLYGIELYIPLNKDETFYIHDITPTVYDSNSFPYNYRPKDNDEEMQYNYPVQLDGVDGYYGHILLVSKVNNSTFTPCKVTFNLYVTYNGTTSSREATINIG